MCDNCTCISTRFCVVEDDILLEEIPNVDGRPSLNEHIVINKKEYQIVKIVWLNDYTVCKYVVKRPDTY